MSEYLKRWGMTCQYPSKKRIFRIMWNSIPLYMNIPYHRKESKDGRHCDLLGWWNRDQQSGISCQRICTTGTDADRPIFFQDRKINMISAINNQESYHFLCYEENMTQQTLIISIYLLLKESMDFHLSLKWWRERKNRRRFNLFNWRKFLFFIKENNLPWFSG